MNKIALGLLFLLLLFVLGGKAFLASNKSSAPSPVASAQVSPSPTPQTTPTTEASPLSTPKSTQTPSVQGTLKSLLSSGKSVKCTFSNKTGKSEVSGTVYISNGKMKGDFKTNVSQNSSNEHIIVDSQSSYSWSDTSSQGVKIETKVKSTSTSSTSTQGLDIDQNITYNCQDWTPDEKVFNLPSNIKFSNLALPSNLPSLKAGCSACDALPEGVGRDTCKSQLNCK